MSNLLQDPESETFSIIMNGIKQRLADLNDGWNIDNGTIYKTDSKGIPRPIAHFIPWISRTTILAETNEKYYSIIGFNRIKNKKLKEVQVTAQSLSTLSWIDKYWGTDAIIPPGNKSKSNLQYLLHLLDFSGEPTYQYNHIGWVNHESQWLYLHSQYKQDSLEVKLDDAALSNYHFPETTSPMPDMASVTTKFFSVAPEKVTVPLFAYMMLAPLTSLLSDIGLAPSFVLWLHGTTQTRKSSLAGVLLSFFGHKHASRSMPCSFQDTIPAMETKGHLLKDALMVIDDYHPTSTSSAQNTMKSKAQTILRMWGDRVGKGRSQGGRKLQTAQPPRGLCLVTGEDLPQVGESGTARYLGLELSPNDVCLEKLTELQNAATVLNRFMASYIAWLQTKYDSLQQTATEKISEYRSQLSSSNSWSPRCCENIAFLFYAWDLALDFLKFCNYCPDQELDNLKTNGYTTLIELGHTHQAIIKEDAPLTLFQKAFRDLLGDNNKIIPVNTASSNSQGHNIGWDDAIFYYLQPEKLYDYLSTYYKRKGMQFPLSPRALWNELAANQLLHSDASQHTYPKRINGSQMRLIWLRKDTLKTMEDVSDDNALSRTHATRIA